MKRISLVVVDIGTSNSVVYHFFVEKFNLKAFRDFINKEYRNEKTK